MSSFLACMVLLRNGAWQWQYAKNAHTQNKLHSKEAKI
jgi:hypothetical protein